MAQEAIALCLEVYREEGRPIPPADRDPRRKLRGLVLVKRARMTRPPVVSGKQVIRARA
jgi:hypothetical protein